MWQIEMTERFDGWFYSLSDNDRASVLAALMVLRTKSPMLPRPYADTIKGSRYNNMKELRVQRRGDPLRIFFAFDPHRIAILLCAGNKVGHEKRFYDVMIPIADRELMMHLQKMENKE